MELCKNGHKTILIPRPGSLYCTVVQAGLEGPHIEVTMLSFSIWSLVVQEDTHQAETRKFGNRPITVQVCSVATCSHNIYNPGRLQLRKYGFPIQTMGDVSIGVKH